MTNNFGSSIETKPEKVTVDNEEHIEMVFNVRNLTFDNAGNYTCEAVWEDPHFSRKDVYTLHVACEYEHLFEVINDLLH